MSLKIEITTTLGGERTASELLDEAFAAVGFERKLAVRDAVYTMMNVRGHTAAESLNPAADTVEQPNAETLATIHDKVDAKPVREPVRERGKPSPGKKRRTAEEVAEDEAADKAEPLAVYNEINSGSVQSISTGEERVGPQDTPEMEAQDAADEAAEADDGKIEDMLTLDDLRKAMSDYVAAYGMPATQADGANILKAALGDLPAGAKNPDGSEAKAWRLSLVPDEQDALRKAVGAWREAIEKNPFKRDAVAKAGG